MNSNSDRLNVRFHELNLDEKVGQENEDGSGKAVEYKQEYEKQKEGDDKSGQKYPVALDSGHIHKRTAKKGQVSLLSSSLAGQKKQGLLMNGEAGVGPVFIKDKNDRMVHQGMLVGDNIDIADDHPEPVLLASSVGKEIDGRLVPSSSNISLLSLNNQYGSAVTEGPEFVQTTGKASIGHLRNMSSGHLHSSINSSGNLIGTAAQQNSSGYNNVSSRTSMTYLNQRRYQPYYKFASPLPGQFSTPPSDPQSAMAGQGIPIQGKYNGKVPDSPSLDPTSLGGSPSKFWLSSQTPPRSIPNLIDKNMRSYLHFEGAQVALTGQQLNQSNLHTFSMTPINDRSNYVTSSTLKYYKLDGNRSPVLNPVNTPLEELPMTPLHLNATTLPVKDNCSNVDSYFEHSLANRYETIEEGVESFLVKDKGEGSEQA